MRIKNIIKKAGMVLAAAFLVQLGANCKSANNNQTNSNNEAKMEKVLSLNPQKLS